MTFTADLTTATPAQIDTAWAEAVAPAQAKLDKAAALRSRAENRIAYWAKRSNGFNTLQAELDREAAAVWTAEADALAEEAKAELEATSAPFKAEWSARDGWTRAYKAGHVHSSTNCSTCHKMGQRTELYWVTELSGMTTDEIAELAGEAACTVCYPNAPVSKATQIFTPAERATSAERAEKVAKLDAKKADKKWGKSFKD